MRRTWQLQDVENRFSEVVEEALVGGPQVIIRRGVETAVVLSYVEFRRLQLGQTKLSEFFRQSPLVEAELDLARDRSSLRENSEQ